MQQHAFDTAIFAGGCFWCTEAVFSSLQGVKTVQSGYIGGSTDQPTYAQVCSGLTGHAEAVRIVFNPAEIDFATLLEVHFKTHDPTALNRQGADVGTHYRSAIFPQSPSQFQTAQLALEAADKSGAWPRPIVTKIEHSTGFHLAEQQHQDYYNGAKAQPYCDLVITPKLEKFRAEFSAMLKPSDKNDV